MAERDDMETPPASAVPIAPREEAVVDGAAVTFEWEPVEGATDYALEVAEDAAFDEVVFEQATGGDTSITVTDVFAQDGRTYYWRVFARNVAGESPGDLVESFISVSADEAAAATAQHVEHPDEEEDLGPAIELHKAAAAEVAAEVTGEEKYFEAEAKLGVQHEGIGAAQILGFILAITVVILMAVAFTFVIMDTTVQAKRTTTATALNYPERRQVEANAAQRLTQYGTTDTGTYRMPVDRAIDLMVNEAYQQPAGSYSPELQLRRED